MALSPVTSCEKVLDPMVTNYVRSQIDMVWSAAVSGGGGLLADLSQNFLFFYDVWQNMPNSVIFCPTKIVYLSIENRRSQLYTEKILL